MIHIIVNPGGASGRTMDYFRKKILPLFSGADYEIHFSSQSDSLTQIASRLTDSSSRKESFVNLAVVGGDGTLNEVLNGIQDFEHTRVGLIPSGSGNDLARGLELPSDPGEIVKRILREETLRQMDVGQTILHDRDVSMLFAVSSGIGFDAQVCHMASDDSVKGVLHKIGQGKLIYLREAVKLILSWESAPAQITYERREGETKDVVRVQDELVFAAGMNHKYEGGGFMLCPKAEADDGKLDLCVVHNLSKTEFFRFFLGAFKGKHVKHKECVTQARRRSVRIQAQRPLWVHVDGETRYTSVDVQFRTAEVRLNLMV